MRTDARSPIVEIYDSLRALNASWSVDIGRRSGSGWIAGMELRMASTGPFNELLLRIGERARTADRRTIAASFALRYGWTSAMAIAPYLKYACVPDVSLENVSLKFRESTFFERTAICGGYQMLGRTIHDPAGMESSAGAADGLGLLPAVTSLSREKQTRAVTATTLGGVRFGGYEIHLGVTTLDWSDKFTPFARLGDGSVDGVRGSGVFGTYLHGAFEHPAVCAEVFGIDAPSATSKAVHYERLAAWFEQHARHRDQLGLD